MARVSDTSMAWKEAGVVQFQTQCSGLQVAIFGRVAAVYGIAAVCGGSVAAIFVGSARRLQTVSSAARR
eukprot:1269997-Rhodomonas_salina.1